MSKCPKCSGDMHLIDHHSGIAHHVHAGSELGKLVPVIGHVAGAVGGLAIWAGRKAFTETEVCKNCGFKR